MLEKLRENWQKTSISNEELEKLSFIKPLVRKNDILYYIEDKSKRDSFTWDPVLTEKAKKLKLDRTVYFCSSSYPGLWKPSMDEVLFVIKNDIDINQIKAVEVEFVEHHKSGSGNIGLAKLYK